MKRKTNTLDAEYKRRGLIRPNQVTATARAFIAEGMGSEVGAETVEFDWKGTTVWGVKA